MEERGHWLSHTIHGVRHMPQQDSNQLSYWPGRLLASTHSKYHCRQPKGILGPASHFTFPLFPPDWKVGSISHLEYCLESSPKDRHCSRRVKIKNHSSQNSRISVQQHLAQITFEKVRPFHFRNEFHFKWVISSQKIFFPTRSGSQNNLTYRWPVPSALLKQP